MKIISVSLPESLLESRRRTGADRWDEKWEGILHTPPMLNRDHQELEGELETWLRIFWARPGGNKVFHQINVASPGGWPERDYRIPDLVLLTPDRFAIDRNEYFEGGPTVVVEIHSPDDEAYEKFPFYAKIGAAEIWVVDRDTRMPEIFVLEQGSYSKQTPDTEGWLTSPTTGVRLCHAPPARLTVQCGGDAFTRRNLRES